MRGSLNHMSVSLVGFLNKNLAHVIGDDLNLNDIEVPVDDLTLELPSWEELGRSSIATSRVPGYLKFYSLAQFEVDARDTFAMDCLNGLASLLAQRGTGIRALTRYNGVILILPTSRSTTTFASNPPANDNGEHRNRIAGLIVVLCWQANMQQALTSRQPAATDGPRQPTPQQPQQRRYKHEQPTVNDPGILHPSDFPAARTNTPMSQQWASRPIAAERPAPLPASAQPLGPSLYNSIKGQAVMAFAGTDMDTDAHCLFGREVWMGLCRRAGCAEITVEEVVGRRVPAIALISDAVALDVGSIPGLVELKMLPSVAFFAYSGIPSLMTPPRPLFGTGGTILVDERFIMGEGRLPLLLQFMKTEIRRGHVWCIKTLHSATVRLKQFSEQAARQGAMPSATPATARVHRFLAALTIYGPSVTSPERCAIVDIIPSLHEVEVALGAPTRVLVGPYDVSAVLLATAARIQQLDLHQRHTLILQVDGSCIRDSIYDSKGIGVMSLTTFLRHFT